MLARSSNSKRKRSLLAGLWLAACVCASRSTESRAKSYRHTCGCFTFVTSMRNWLVWVSATVRCWTNSVIYRRNYAECEKNVRELLNVVMEWNENQKHHISITHANRRIDIAQTNQVMRTTTHIQSQFIRSILKRSSDQLADTSSIQKFLWTFRTQARIKAIELYTYIHSANIADSMCSIVFLYFHRLLLMRQFSFVSNNWF